MAKMALVTLADAQAILTERGIPMEISWLRQKAADGKIDGAVKVGSPNKGMWLVPRRWAETYVKIKSGRPRKEFVA